MDTAAGALRWRLFAGASGVATAVLAVAWVVSPRWDVGGQELLEGWTILAVLCAPGALAVLSLLGRPVLLLVGAIVSTITSPLLGTLMPVMWLFAAIYAVAYVRQPTRRTLAPGWVVALSPVVPMVVGGSLIILLTEMTCTTSIVGRGTAVECGETTTTSGSIGALIAVGFALAVALILSSPRPGLREEDGSG